MNKIQEFFNEQFGTVRSVAIDDIVYFYGIDFEKIIDRIENKYLDLNKVFFEQVKKEKDILLKVK